MLQKVAALSAHFRNILGSPELPSGGIDLDHLYNQHQRADAATLTAAFTAAEARRAVFAMNPYSAPGPDGLGPGFYRAAWSTVERDVMHFLHDFHSGSMQLDCLNRAFIVLLPKKPGATSPADYHPISLQNCPVKILSKILTSRLQMQIQNLVDRSDGIHPWALNLRKLRLRHGARSMLPPSQAAYAGCQARLRQGIRLCKLG
jgi:hypothetical protein